MTKWVKPNGNKIETNDEAATVAYCKSLDWAEDKPKAAKPKPSKKG